MFDGVSWLHSCGSILRMVLISGLSYWDKFQMSCTGKGNGKGKLCAGYQQVGIDSLKGERPINYGQT